MNTMRAIAALGLATGAIALLDGNAAAQCPSAAADVRTVAATPGDRMATKDIVETAVAAGSFKTLAAALQAADLVEALQGAGPFTVFAPTDEAFAKLPKGTVETLLRPENKRMLRDILTYHVVAGRVPAADVVTLSAATTLNGQRVNIATSAAGDRIDDAKVVTTDIACRNGLIHVIDRVVMPNQDSILTTASKAGTFTILAAAIKSAGLESTLEGAGPFTVFAPTDAAFAKLPAGTVESLLLPENRQRLIDILTYHVVPGRVFAADALAAPSLKTVQGASVTVRMDGSTPRVDTAGITATDIDAANGVIHVIDQVILPGRS